MPGPCGSLRVSPGTAAAWNSVSAVTVTPRSLAAQRRVYQELLRPLRASRGRLRIALILARLVPRSGVTVTYTLQLETGGVRQWANRARTRWKYSGIYGGARRRPTSTWATTARPRRARRCPTRASGSTTSPARAKRTAAPPGGPGWSARASSARPGAWAISSCRRTRRTRAETVVHVDYPGTVPELTQRLRDGGYLADRGLATTLLMSLSLRRPVLLEGEVGVGKTEVAKVLAGVFGRRLIRLQCYEGISVSQALYEWDYARQMLQIRALSPDQATDERSVDQLFGPKFLLERPLLEAIRQGDRAVLLIDEVDRADDEFEAFLLEMLSDFQITIPELGTIRADSPPVVILTSNRTRELHDALRRRCLYHWIGYPTAAREAEIVAIREPAAAGQLIGKVVAAAQRLRELDLAKPPGVAETIDWVRTLGVLGEVELTPEAANDTLGAVVKDRDDLDLVRENLAEIISGG